MTVTQQVMTYLSKSGMSGSFCRTGPPACSTSCTCPHAGKHEPQLQRLVGDLLGAFPVRVVVPQLQQLARHEPQRFHGVQPLQRPEPSPGGKRVRHLLSDVRRPSTSRRFSEEEVPGQLIRRRRPQSRCGHQPVDLVALSVCVLRLVGTTRQFLRHRMIWPLGPFDRSDRNQFQHGLVHRLMGDCPSGEGHTYSRSRLPSVVML
jgi:hypothetical protein